MNSVSDYLLLHLQPGRHIKCATSIFRPLQLVIVVVAATPQLQYCYRLVLWIPAKPESDETYNKRTIVGDGTVT